jgi:hypothetical protein
MLRFCAGIYRNAAIETAALSTYSTIKDLQLAPDTRDYEEAIECTRDSPADESLSLTRFLSCIPTVDVF